MVPAPVAILLACIVVVLAVAVLWLTLSLLDWKVKADSQKARTDNLDQLNGVLRKMNENLRTDYVDQKAEILKLRDDEGWKSGEIVRLTKLNDDNIETIARLSVEKSKALDDVLAAEETNKTLAEVVQTITTERDQANVSITKLNAECMSLQVKLAEQIASHQDALRTLQQVTETKNSFVQSFNEAKQTIDRLNKLIESHAETSCGPSNTQIQQALERARGQFKDGVDQLVMRQALGNLRNGLDSAMKQLQNSLLSGIDRIGGELRTSLLNTEGEEVPDDEDDGSYLNNECAVNDDDDDVEDGSDTDWDDDEDDSELEDGSDLE